MFVVISQIWHIEIRPNSHRLSVLKAILLSGEFQANRILGSTDICLGTTPNHIYGDIFLCL